MRHRTRKDRFITAWVYVVGALIFSTAAFLESAWYAAVAAAVSALAAYEFW
jgi:hypothetical protein